MTTVAVIGDSQAQGIVFYGNLPDQLVAQGLQYVGGYQLPGAPTREIAANVSRLFDRTIPDVVIVFAGGNETVGAAQTASWRSLVEVLQAYGVKQVFWVSPPASPDPARDRGRAAVSAAQRPVVEAAGATWISGRDTAQGIPRRDDVHLTNDGYRTWAQRIAGTVGASMRGSFAPVVVGLAGLAAAYLVKPYRGPILIATLALSALLYYRETREGKAPQLLPR